MLSHSFAALIASVTFVFVPTIAWAESTLQLLLDGKYREIKEGKSAEEKAAWAFARFHLAPSKQMAEAATQAHEAGHDLGSFVLLLCQRKGMHVRFNEAVLNKLNFDLRQKLDAKQKLSALESYMRSRLTATNEKGSIHGKTPEDIFKQDEENRKRNWDHLCDAAENGVAEACDTIGAGYQADNDMKLAYEWYGKAAKMGLASGLKNQAFLLLRGLGAEKDEKLAARIMTDAAERGDVFAMVNLGVFYDRGMGVKPSQKAAQKWIDRAAGSGHWMGLIEKGLALLQGTYGYKKNVKEGQELLQKAVQTQSPDVLLRIANWYVAGNGLEKNGKKAIEFAEAAFVQGDRKAAEFLAAAYAAGLDGVPQDKRLHLYWFGQSNHSLAHAVNINDSDPELAERLKKIDPAQIVVE